MLKSQRVDGRGHWPAGKPRSSVTPAQAARCISRIEAACKAASMRQVARLLGMSDVNVRRLRKGLRRPSDATYATVMNVLRPY